MTEGLGSVPVSHRDPKQMEDPGKKMQEASKNYQDLLRVIIEHKEFIEIEEKMKLNDSIDMGDETNPEEDALEAIACFNDNMNTIAMNAFQMEKLLSLSMQENKVIEDWLSQLNKTTEETEHCMMNSINITKQDF